MNLPDDYLKRWNLILDGERIITSTSELLPVIYKSKKCMLKIALVEEERQGNRLMVWWNGNGAASVLAHDDHALLMERAVAGISLAEKARQGEDSETSQIICEVANKLHARKNNLPALVPLNTWFQPLEIAASREAGIFSKAWMTARELLVSLRDEVVLHGDLHHGNILNFGKRGWLAIDPKHIQGERGYDFANIFCNPDSKLALKPGRFQEQLQIVSHCARLNKKRLLQWILAYAGLSAAWHLEDNCSPDLALAIAEIASLELAR